MASDIPYFQIKFIICPADCTSGCRKTTLCYDSEMYPINRKNFLLLPCGLLKISALLSYCYTPTCQKRPGSLPVPEKSGKRVCQPSVAVATQAVPLPVSFENVFRQHWKAVLQPAPSPETTTHPSIRSSCKLQGKAPWRRITTSLSTVIHEMIWCNFLTSFQGGQQPEPASIPYLPPMTSCRKAYGHRENSEPPSVHLSLPYIWACALLYFSRERGKKMRWLT